MGQGIRTMRVALGWNARSGWAAPVAVSGDACEPQVVERSCEHVATGRAREVRPRA